ncbi:spore germination lipoprotein GerD [Virgibacillus litoralis]|uniref:Spore germination protein D n=1 Tax=Virgibacillus litoralis TaxID=578221 RepID=A0ABS4HGR1_9BACI|nr:spore germination lipoprotein GerD [Virgibacillus litoralis]MBP1950073.1 spore germination protein D [Virgibacillus litoralis]
MFRMILTSLIILSIIFISACNGGGASGKEADYDATKKMVVDILQTEDGKKALREILADEKLKQQLVIESEVVKKSINEVLVSEKGKEMWKKLFEDPEFVKSYAKSISEEQKKLMKNLMSDSEYQKQMLELMQNPQISEQMLSVMKGQEFRKHLEETVQQTLQTPLFQAKISEILLKAAEEKSKQESGQQSGGEGGGSGGGSGGSGGGGSGGGSGGSGGGSGGSG